MWGALYLCRDEVVRNLDTSVFGLLLMGGVIKALAHTCWAITPSVCGALTPRGPERCVVNMLAIS